MKYRIIDNVDRWIGNQAATEENTLIDEEELKRLSIEWDKPVEELLEDLEPCRETERHADAMEFDLMFNEKISDWNMRHLFSAGYTLENDRGETLFFDFEDTVCSRIDENTVHVEVGGSVENAGDIPYRLATEEFLSQSRFTDAVFDILIEGSPQLEPTGIKNLKFTLDDGKPVTYPRLESSLNDLFLHTTIRETKFQPHVDWRGFTQQDFENLQANKKHDPQYEFNHEFYVGDLKLYIADEEWSYNPCKQIRLFTLDHGGTPEAHPHEVFGRLTLNMDEIRNLSYDEFRDKVESHLFSLVKDSRYTSQEEKDALIGIMQEPSPKSWAYAHVLDLTSVSKELIRNDGKTLQDIEREWVKPNSRKNMLLHGSSKNLMKKLEASLKKDKEIKKLLSRSGNKVR